uniref:Uncharacterized protein n=1 Tax=Panagrolaimus sp. JU765 TaxID=591449 RepID=A0AC34RQI2_9BILA
MGKLHEIRDNLRELREQRLTMPTLEYYRKYAPDLKGQVKTGSTTSVRTENVQTSTRKWRRNERTEIPSLAELKAKILNMDLNVEKRTREILDGAYRKYTKLEEEKELEEDLTKLMPEWLKNEESIVEKMEKEEKEIMEKVTGQKTNEIEKEKPKPEIVQQKNEEKSAEDEVVIAPTRTLILNPTPVSNVPKIPEAVIPPTNPVVPEVSKPLQPEYSSPPQKPDSSAYSKMLELLKPTKYVLSTVGVAEDATGQYRSAPLAQVRQVARN